MSSALEVCAAVIICCGRLLLATRRPGGYLAGCWEFPGGKVRPAETLADCIARELQEELALTVEQASLLFSCSHAETGRQICLHFMHCEIPCGQSPLPREGQQAAWFSAGELSTLSWVPADALAIEHIRCGRWQGPEDPGDDLGLPRLADWERTRKLQQWLTSK